MTEHIFSLRKPDCSLMATLDDAARAWLDNVYAVRKRSTYVSYKAVYQNRIAPHFGKQELNTLTENDIRNILIFFAEEGFSRKSSNYYHTTSNVFKRILMFANVPVDFSGISKSIILPQRPHYTKIETFSPSEQKKLINYLTRNLTSLNLGILFTLFTGCRLGEICALLTADISLEERVVHIHQTVQRLPVLNSSDAPQKKAHTSLEISSPKTSSSDRFVPLSSKLLSLLHKQLPSSKFLLNKDKVMDPRTMEEYFKRVQKKVGIEPRNFHVLRHPYVKSTTKKYLFFLVPTIQLS